MTTLAIVCVGDELLDGRVVDRNARHLIERAATRRWTITERRTVADDRGAICQALDDLCGADLIVVSGGLGPTDDDRTRQAAAELVEEQLVEDASTLAFLKRRFDDRNRGFTENNRRQARFPKRAAILCTEVGTAPGFRLEYGGSDYFFFPGVPREFRWFADTYLPRGPETSKTRTTLSFFGRGESDLETDLGDIPNRARDRGVDIGFRAAFPLIEISLTGSEEACRDVEAEIRDAADRWLVAAGSESFAERTGRRLAERGATVSVAESCTAGLLGAKLTEVSGSSRYFEEGYLTYSNESKQRLVNVDSEMLDRFGAVSPRVVAQMAVGARHRSRATYALAISGIAGPTGGTDEKPVGTVDFALATPKGTFVRRATFLKRNRRQVRILSVHMALAVLLWRLESRLVDEHRIRGPLTDEQVRGGEWD